MSCAHWITHSQTVTGWLPEAHVTPASLFCVSSHEHKALWEKGSVSQDRICILGQGGDSSPKRNTSSALLMAGTLEAGDY